MTEDWHSGTALTGWLRSATGTNARILANPAPLRNCIRITKRQQWRTDSPKKLTTLPPNLLLSPKLTNFAKDDVDSFWEEEKHIFTNYLNSEPHT